LCSRRNAQPAEARAGASKISLAFQRAQRVLRAECGSRSSPARAPGGPVRRACTRSASTRAGARRLRGRQQGSGKRERKICQRLMTRGILALDLSSGCKSLRTLATPCDKPTRPFKPRVVGSIPRGSLRNVSVSCGLSAGTTVLHSCRVMLSAKRTVSASSPSRARQVRVAGRVAATKRDLPCLAKASEMPAYRRGLP
jgi:hypothetical protein